MSVYALIMAAGEGARMGLGVNKALISLRGVPMVKHAANAYRGLVDGIVIVTRGEDIGAMRTLFLETVIVEGGQTRQQSVLRGLSVLPSDAEFVLVHDAARPFVGADVITNCIESVKMHGSGVASIPITDTCKQVDEKNIVIHTPPRHTLRAAQTPQAFPVAALKEAIEALESIGKTATDDASAMELSGHQVMLVEGSVENRKITTTSDLEWAEWYVDMLEKRKSCGTERRFYVFEEQDGTTAALRPPTSDAQIAEKTPVAHDFAFSNNPLTKQEMTLPFGVQEATPRVGLGFDAHRLVEGRPLILCGVHIPYEKGLLGHSDADVALHALMDAMLGAAAMGDIGGHFSDRDPAYKGIASTDLLEKTVTLLSKKGVVTRQADITIVAEKPRLAPYIHQMRARVAEILCVALVDVNVKATTTEGLGFEGEGKGISAQAVVSVLYMRHG